MSSYQSISTIFITGAAGSLTIIPVSHLQSYTKASPSDIQSLPPAIQSFYQSLSKAQSHRGVLRAFTNLFYDFNLSVVENLDGISLEPPHYTSLTVNRAGITVILTTHQVPPHILPQLQGLCISPLHHQAILSILDTPSPSWDYLVSYITSHQDRPRPFHISWPQLQQSWVNLYLFGFTNLHPIIPFISYFINHPSFSNISSRFISNVSLLSHLFGFTSSLEFSRYLTAALQSLVKVLSNPSQYQSKLQSFSDFLYTNPLPAPSKSNLVSQAGIHFRYTESQRRRLSDIYTNRIFHPASRSLNPASYDIIYTLQWLPSSSRSSRIYNYRDTHREVPASRIEFLVDALQSIVLSYCVFHINQSQSKDV